MEFLFNKISNEVFCWKKFPAESRLWILLTCILISILWKTFYVTKYFSLDAEENPLKTAKYTADDDILQRVIKFSEEITESDDDDNEEEIKDLLKKKC